MDSKANTLPYDLPEDAVWFITGCSSGIGQSLAKLLLANPTYRVVATARKTSTLSGLAGADGTDSRLLTMALDVTSTESIDAAVAAALSRFGRIDVLVNNAGYGFRCDIEASKREDEDRQFETNFWGPVALSKHAVRVMREENPKQGGQMGGVVINVSSMGGFTGYPGNDFYHASKFALEGFTEAIAKEMRPEWNIHFCIAEPGAVKTEFHNNVVKGPQHPAYTAPDTPSRQVEQYLANPAASETWAEPDATAQAMIDIVVGGRKKEDGGAGRIPIRVPIGVDAFAAVKFETEKVAADLKEFRDLSLSTQNALDDSLKAVLGLP